MDARKHPLCEPIIIDGQMEVKKSSRLSTHQISICEYFAVHDGRQVLIPAYKNTAHALYTISRVEVLVFNYSKDLSSLFHQ
jgi:hypothetical protein